MATRDKPLKDLVGVWPIFGYKFWIQILHSDLEVEREGFVINSFLYLADF